MGDHEKRLNTESIMKSSLKIMFVAAAWLAIPAFAGAAEVQENWTKNCQKCHGADGSGTTVIGKKLKLKNYTDPVVQAAMSDEEMLKVITEGAKDEAGKSTMPGYGGKMTVDEIRALVGLVRSFKKG